MKNIPWKSLKEALRNTPPQLGALGLGVALVQSGLHWLRWSVCPQFPSLQAVGCWAPHTMFSVLSYGRLVARAVLGGLSQTDSRDYSLVTASCGFGKDFRKGILKKGMCYGDDACFVARHRSADVLGKCLVVAAVASPPPVCLPPPPIHTFCFHSMKRHPQGAGKGLCHCRV